MGSEHEANQSHCSDDDELVPATSYITRTQYESWQDEAAERNQSVSSFIATRVEMGLNDVPFVENSVREIRDLRQELNQVKRDRKQLRKELEQKEQQTYHVGLGKIKDLIIENPGMDRPEIMHYVSENPFEFVDQYLEQLEQTEFVKKRRNWYPPEDWDEST